MTGGRIATASLAMALCATSFADPAQAQRAGLEGGRFVATASDAWIVDPGVADPEKPGRLTGPAVFHDNGRGFAVYFCGHGEAGPWEGRLLVRDAMGRAARSEARAQERRERAAARREGRDPAEPAGSATSPSYVGTYPLDNYQVGAGLSGRRFSHQLAATGTIEVASHDTELLAGSARLSFPVQVYGTSGNRTVDWDLAFRAIPGTPRDCWMRAREEAER